MQLADHLTSIPISYLAGEMEVASDKSISHRAVLLASIAEGRSLIQHFLSSKDCLATVDILRHLGVTIQQRGKQMEVIGVGLYGLRAPTLTLNCGNSGTSIRLLTGLLAGQAFASTLSGDASLRSRPMQRIIKPLAIMGAGITAQTKGTPPLNISACDRLQAIDYALPIPSAQLKSSLLLASLYAQGTSRLSACIHSRDHTERMLQAFSCALQQDTHSLCLAGGSRLKATTIDVPGDFSSAFFFIVAGTILPKADILIKRVGVNPSRIAALTILKEMGGKITLSNKTMHGLEPVADIEVRSASLQGITVPESLVANAIDEFPALFIAMACAQGKSRLCGAEELRVKESDRLAVMAEGLRACRAKVALTEDGLCIDGGSLQGGRVDSHGDHRVAMAFLIAGAVAQDEIRVHNCLPIATSFPHFVDTAKSLGMNIQA